MSLGKIWFTGDKGDNLFFKAVVLEDYIYVCVVSTWNSPSWKENPSKFWQIMKSATQGSLSLKIMTDWARTLCNLLLFNTGEWLFLRYLPGKLLNCASCLAWTETHFSLVLSQNPNFPATPIEFVVGTDEAYTTSNVSVEIGKIAPKPGESEITKDFNQLCLNLFNLQSGLKMGTKCSYMTDLLSHNHERRPQNHWLSSKFVSAVCQDPL